MKAQAWRSAFSLMVVAALATSNFGAEAAPPAKPQAAAPAAAASATPVVGAMAKPQAVAPSPRPAQPLAVSRAAAATVGAIAQTPALPADIRQAMQDRKYAEARKAIDAAAASGAAPADYLAYLGAWSFYLDKQYREAVSDFEQIEKRHPQSPWLRPVRFAKAMALARLGDFRAAGLIYRAESTYLLAPGRRRELAESYLELADRRFKPPQGEKPDYAKALPLYTQALAMGVEGQRREEIELRAAECNRKLDRIGEAAKAYAQFLADHPASPMAIEARFSLGECRLVEKNPREARRVWQDLLATYPDGKSPRAADAAFLLAQTWGVPAPDADEQLRRGVASLAAFLERFPNDDRWAEAHVLIARSFVHRERFDDAAVALNRFIKDPRARDRKEVAHAWNLLGQTCQLQEKYAEALATWREFLVRFPANEAATEVQSAIVNTEYLRALAEYRAKRCEPAVKLLREFMEKYPLDSRNPGILFLLGQIAHEQKQFDAALSEWRRLASKHPRSEEASQAELRIARTLEEDQGKLDEALAAYRSLTEGAGASVARQAVARLTAPSLIVVTPRVFRSDETPSIQLITRNIDAVAVRVYRLDLETYFRKMHTAGGAESLDVSLIDPDRVVQFKVPGYEKHRQLESTVPTPLPGGGEKGDAADVARAARGARGAMIVAVSASTLETSTLVIQSDVELIAKGSANELFVLTEDMRLGKPRGGVRLLFADGQGYFAEAATGVDGVCRAALPPNRKAGPLRILALADGHVASNEVTLPGPATARRVSDRGYLDTDRPAYAPGQKVGLRGCLRRAAGDGLTISKGRKYTVEVLDPRNRPVWQNAVSLSAAGSFQAEFSLPTNCPPGTYRIVAHDDDGYSFAGAFRVQQPRREPIRLEIETPKRVYCRGDAIRGVVRARYDYGAAVAGKEIRYQLEGQPIRTATTDAEGAVRFDLPTGDFDETQEVRFAAAMPAAGLRAEQTFRLANEDMSVQVRTARLVFAAGETIEATLTARDADSRPVAASLVLKVFELVSVGGKIGQRPVEERKVSTAADGAARANVKIAKAGRYLLSVEGVDAFRNPVSDHVAVKISGEEDQQRLLILADRHTFHAGDTAQLDVLWRDKPALGLLTLEADGVLWHRIVTLNQGVNRLAIPLEARFAPNCDFAVAVMSDGRGPAEKPSPRFHQASTPLAIQRDLRVQMTLRRPAGAVGPLRPGESVAIDILTADPQGRPVAAEVSLSMMQQSLWDRFAASAIPIQGAFYDGPRDPAVHTASSITFACRPKTRAIEPRLLAERERQELADEEEASRREPLTPPAPQPSRPEAAVAKKAGGTMSDFTELVALIDQTQPKPVWEGDWVDVPVRTHKGSLASERSGKDRPSEPSLPISGEAAGYWNPSVTTGADGRASVTVVLPAESTAWTLLAKAITADTRVGQSTETLHAEDELFGDLRLPAALTDGDTAEVSAVVHNSLVAAGPIEVVLKTTIGGRSVEEKRTLQAKAKGIFETPFTVAVRRPEKPEKAAEPGAAALDESAVVFDLAVIAGQRRHALRRTVPLVPYGATVVRTAGGSATGDATAWVETPQDMPLESPTLAIVVGPSVERSLLDILRPADTRDWCFVMRRPTASDEEVAAGDVLAALALVKLVGPGPDATMLDGRIRTALGQLALAQKDDGSWGGGPAVAGDLATTARAIWALRLAQKAGYPVAAAAMDKATDFLRKQLAGLRNDDYDNKAMAQHVLCVSGQGDFALTNHLYRQRNSLAPAALVYLALALAESDRSATAREILGLLEAGPPAALGASVPPRHTPVERLPFEVRALAALCWQKVAPQGPQAKAAAEWLLANRTGHRWFPERATGPAAMALCAWFAQNRFQGEHYKLAVSVNDVALAEWDVKDAAATRVLRVPATNLKPGKQRIQFRLTGRGRYTYQCLLGGFVSAEKLKSTTADWEVKRHYEPAPQEFDGRPVPRGFDVVDGAFQSFRNPLSQLPAARRGQVTLELWRKAPAAGESARAAEPMIVYEPLPAGASVVEASLRGGYDRVEMLPGALVFFYGGRNLGESIEYQFDGVLPGTYRTSPTIVASAVHPDRFAVSSPGALAILPALKASADAYRYSPKELFELGKLLRAKGDLAGAAAKLTELIERWNTKADVYREAVEALLDLHLELGPAAKVVQYFEIVKEKWPEREIPFAKAVKVGAAYHDIGEFERSYLVFRATVEASFTRDSGAAGLLDAQGEFLRSVEVMDRLLCEYPPEPYAVEAELALAQRVYGKAAEAAADPALRRAKVNRVVLVRRAWQRLENFLTAYPTDPAADRAAFAAANALLELKNYDDAAAAANRYAARFPQSELLDAYWYIVAYSHFAAGRHEPAMAMCRKVAEATRTDPDTGKQIESANKWRAIYILGQIHQSLAQAAEAIAQYRRVEDKFPDARAQIEYYLRRGMELPEVTTVKPGAAVSLPLRYSNIEACDVAVYRIDLMKFGLARGDLSGVSRINLAGIRPLHSAAVPLGDGKDYRERTHALPLPLKDEGAYLVVCRGGDRYGTGLVLVTPLSVEVQYDPQSGQVRSMVKDATTDRYLTGIDVKVMGDPARGFVAGATDLRGVFTAEGVRGDPTVVAQAGPRRYAFFRWTGGPMAALGPDAARIAATAPKPPPSGKADDDEPFGPELRTPAGPPPEASSAPKRSSAERPVAKTAPRPATPSEQLWSTGEAIDMGGQGPEESRRRILAALDSTTECDFVDTPLAQAIGALKRRHQIEMLLDRVTLVDEGAQDKLVSLQVRGVTLRSALRRMLRELDLTYVIRDEALIVTTRAAAEEPKNLATVAYPAADLLGVTGSANDDADDFAELIGLISETVAKESWSDNGGNATIKESYNTLSLVVSQTQENHDEIVQVLADLRKEGGKPAVAAYAAKARARAAAEYKAAAESGERRGAERTPFAMGLGPVVTPGKPDGAEVGAAGSSGMSRSRAGRDSRTPGMAGGGRGGMGMGFGGPGAATPPPDTGGGGLISPRSSATSSGAARSAKASAGVDLLEGLRSANQQFQGQAAKRLQQRYQGGMGMGGMGGMGGGISAGAINQSK